MQQTTLDFEHNTAIAPAKGLTASVAIIPATRVGAFFMNQCLGANDNWVRVGLLPGEYR